MGNGDPYNGPHLGGLSIPLGWDGGLTTGGLERAVALCLVQVNHALLDQLFPHSYDVQSTAVPTRIAPTHTAEGDFYFLVAETHWSGQGWRGSHRGPYQLDYRYRAGFGADHDLRSKLSVVHPFPFDLSVAFDGKKETYRLGEGLATPLFMVGEHAKLDPKGMLVDQPIVNFEFYHVRGDPMTGAFSKKESGGVDGLGPVVDHREFYRCLEVELFRDGLGK